jgi:hypothetical protein
MRTKGDRFLAVLYLFWAIPSILIALMAGKASPENLTRIMVIAFLLAQIALRKKLSGFGSRFTPPVRFVLCGIILACIVEGFHMISTPVFPAVKVFPTTPAVEAAKFLIIDLIYTVPAYVVIFSVIWYFARRFEYTTWQYILTMGLGQVIGDGGLFFFLAAPGMLVFLPYPMSNYHAVNILPYFTVRDELKNRPRESGAKKYLATPAIILTYIVCGAAIKIVGRQFGYE